jgi:hypothetical protein
MTLQFMHYGRAFILVVLAPLIIFSIGFQIFTRYGKVLKIVTFTKNSKSENYSY